MKIKKRLFSGAAFLLSIILVHGQSAAPTAAVLPSASQIKWANAEMGVLIHYDINVFADGGYEAVDYARKSTLPPLSAFHPSRLNTDQWIASAKKAGAKYAVLVAKHGTGFTLWPSKANEYNVGNTPFRGGHGDILKEFIASCKKYGLKPGIYYNTNYNAWYGAGYTKISDEERLKYNEMVYQQLYEIWATYGRLFEIWFDGGVMVDKKTGIGEKVSSLLRKYQPDAVLFQGPLSEKNLLRWAGNEDGSAPYPNWSRADATTSATGTTNIPDLNGNPDGRYWIPAETDFPNRKNGGWLWKAKTAEQPPFSADELLERYYTSVGRNGNMLIGMVIDTSGLFPATDSLIFEQLGKKLQDRAAAVVGKTQGKGDLVIRFKTPVEITQAEIQEDIEKGQRVRSYTVEGLVNGNWKKLCEGISIGYKRIQLVDAVKVSAVRLTLTKSEDIPLIKSFKVFYYR